MENGLLVGCVYLDLSKAFDTIGHSVLLEKLILYGVCGPELAWFTDYLFNRTQLVEINNAVSDVSAIMSGVPQGSILGPLMFIVFFDDFKDNLVNCDVTQYADDTVIMFAHKDVEIVEKVLNSDMNHISRYCTENELLLNLKKAKTEVMLMGTAQRLHRHGRELNISYNDQPINVVDEYVYLGNVIDNLMTLTPNFDRAFKKASGRLRLLQRIRGYLTVSSAETIFNSTILPILTYSNAIKTSNATQLSKFESLEKRAANIIGSKLSKTIKKSIDHQICVLVKNCLQRKVGHGVFDNYLDVTKHGKQTRNNKCMIKSGKLKIKFILWRC